MVLIITIDLEAKQLNLLRWFNSRLAPGYGHLMVGTGNTGQVRQEDSPAVATLNDDPISRRIQILQAQHGLRGG